LLAFFVSAPAALSLHKTQPEIYRDSFCGPQPSGKGFDLVIPDGISLSGRIVCREREEQPAE
jgi:hypothetical protein